VDRSCVTHRVLIVDDSGLMRNTIRQIIAADDELVVVGEAEDGSVAIKYWISRCRGSTDSVP
jgi:chemotaxis response regulator CheB